MPPTRPSLMLGRAGPPPEDNPGPRLNHPLAAALLEPENSNAARPLRHLFHRHHGRSNQPRRLPPSAWLPPMF